MKSIIKWFAGVILIFAGLGSLGQGAIITSIFYILGGAICLPPVMKMLEEKLSKNFQTWQKYLAVISCFILGAVAMPKSLTDGSQNRQTNTSYSSPVKEITPEQKEQKAKEEREAKIKEQKAQTITAPDLASIYQENEIKADENFKDKKFYVSGTVMEIKKDIMDNAYVELKGDGVFRNVQCFFDDAKTISDLKKGQKITLHGKCHGLMMNVLMKDCQIVANL